MKWLLILFGIAANASASVLVKLATRTPTAPGGSPLQMLLNPLLIAAVASYGLAFVLYSASLTRFPLNVAHPVTTAGAVVAVGLVSWLGFREPIPAATAIGYALLVAGIVFLALGMRNG
jgi:multidrug transporter EmrE-like cation transporter